MKKTIAVLQDLLTRLGYLTGTFAKGEIDAPTLAALQRFQQLHGLFATAEPDDRTWEILFDAFKRGECVVTGQVVDTVGPIPRVTVEVRDRDLGDADHWILLGTTQTDPDGRFVIFYSMETVLPGDRIVDGSTAVADLVFALREMPVQFEGFDVHRLPAGDLVGDDEKALGIQARPLEDVRITARTTERRAVPGETEFEQLLAAFHAVWPQVPPDSLDDGRREPEFVAREIDQPRERIEALVGAFRLQNGLFLGVVPAAILYGVARSEFRLVDVAHLALATSSQLKDAITQAIDRRIIPAQAVGVIERAILLIHELTASQALSEPPAAGGAPYREVLRTALPDEKQQVALLHAAAGREADPLAMWKALREHPAFAEPGAVDRAQFALQLDAVTNGHLPLMQALQQEHGIKSMRGLLDLDADQLRATIVRPEVGVPGGMPGESDSDRADAYVTGLVGQVQTAFPTETTAKLIDRTPAEVVGGGTVRAGVVAALSRGTSEAMRKAGTAFDIHATHIDAYLADHGEELLVDVSEEARPAVVSALKRTQRLFRVSTSPDSLDWLLRNDYHSAFQIAEVPRQTFIREATVALGESQARMLHSRARAVGDATLMSYVQMNDALFGIYPAALLSGEDRIVAGKAIRAVVAKHMPTWQALFGEGALCDCSNCRSVYSPAAYLVDLLNFLDRSTRTGTGKTPLDLLLARRPDLAGIELTCENTNTETPYVDLVNEVLESLVVALDPSKIPSFDTEGATADELRAAPQHTNWDAYVTPDVPGAKARLDRAVYPRSLPFDAPLAAARTYLQHLGVGRADLMSAFADGSLTNALAAERLGLNPSMFEVISGEMLEGKPGDLSASLDDRYGWTETPPELKLGDIGPFVWTLKRKLAASGAALAIGDVPASESFDADVQAAVEAFQTDRALPVTGIVDAASWAALALHGPPFVSAVLQHVPSFLARSGLTFQELVKVLETRFVNPEAHVFEIVRDLHLPAPELLAFIQGGFHNPDAALAKALQDAGLAEADFTIWARAHFDGEPGIRLRQTLLVDGPTDAGCNLDLLTIRHWDPATRTPTEAEWLKLDRFIRLWRTVAWPLEEIDLALSSLGATDITVPVLRQLAQIGEFARLLDLSIPQVVALWADPDPTRPRSLYSQRFSSRALLRLDPAFQTDWAGRVLVGAKVGEHLSALQSGLRVSGADLAVLRTDLGLADDSSELRLDRIGSLLRSVTLARALRLNVRDLVLLRDLTGLQPFGPPSDDWMALRFAREVRRIQGSGLNPAQLAMVLGDVTMPEPNLARDQLLQQLKEGLQAIATDLDRASETDGSLTRHALTLLLVDPRLVDEVLAVLLGTDRATAVFPKPAVPAPVIPPEWSQRLVYEASPLSPSLSCLGALTDAERKTIEGFSTDAGYLAAVTRVHAAPRAVLQNFAAVLTELGVTSPPAGQLLAKTLFVGDAVAREKIASERLALLLDSILPSLRDRLGRTLIKQTLAAVQPDAAMLAFLMEGERAPGKPLMPAASDATRPLIMDFLGLVASADKTAAAQGYELLVRLRRLSESLSLGAEDVRVLARHLVAFRSNPGRLCTYDDWTTIASYARVRGRSGQTAGVLATFWEAGSTESARAALALLLGWTEETIADLMDSVGLSLELAKVQQLATLERLIAVGEMVVRLGVSVKQAAAWARLPIGQVAADEARRAVKARYDEPAWLEVAGTLSDPLRDGRRAALVAYLPPRLGLPDANALYQRLLIDVEMRPCMTTSRIKQAISSTQLFVQRCLLNLEPAVPPEAIDDQDWKWMQNYRVWEANRKVLLYPENWIMPELRDDKTPFFRELESDLLQNDVSDANVERALETYLEKLDAVAKLEIIAMHVQEDFEPDEKLRTVVHVFGRSANPPHAHHYRRYVVTHNGTGLWTPWEPMPVAIQGTLVAPVIFNRRLYVFWATLTTKARASNPPPQQYQEVQLSWSEYRDGAWSPTYATEAGQVVADDYDPTQAPGLTIQGEPRPAGIIERLEARVENDRLRLFCIADRQFTVGDGHTSSSGKLGIDGFSFAQTDGNEAITDVVGTFSLGGCHAQVVRDEKWTGENRLDGVVMRLASHVPGNHALEAKPLSAKPPAAAAATVLGVIGDRSRIAEGEWVHGDGGYLVFEDDRRTFLAQVTQRRPGVAAVLVDADSAYPRRASTGASGGIASPTTTRSRLTATLTQAEAAGHPWVTATFSLAGAGLASLASAGGAVVAGNPSQPSLADPPIHVAVTAALVGEQLAVGRSDVSVRFEPLFHPFVCTYIKALRQYGVDGVLTLGNQQLRLTPDFAGRYLPNRTTAPAPYPTSAVDFGATAKPGIYRSSAYSVYNWELFFHLPMLVADRLTQNRRFEDARRWLHYVFNPTDGTGTYWRVVPFQTTPTQSIEEWLQQLNAGDPDLQQQIAEWKDHPFEPHRIARMRLPAYKKFVVMQYLDNLIAWGDDLFRRDTIESINAATQLYVMAADLLGARPEKIPSRGEPRSMTFAEMRGKLDALSNAAAEFENAVPFLSNSTMARAAETVGLLGVSRSLYFCLPPNDKLLAYWDTVADRLFKVRNCMNLGGVVRRLPLFESPIDPALLVAAAAQGLDIGSVLGDLGAPLPHHRFRFTFQRALEACSDVKALGAALLSTLEKKDAEELAMLRATQEATLRKTMRESRRQQELEALEQVEGLKHSRATPVERLLHFRGLMGLDATVPELGADVPIVAYDPKPSAEGGVFLIDEELQELEASHSARDWQVISGTTEILASLSHYIPTLDVRVSPVTSIAFGGVHVGPGLSAIARYQSILGAEDTYDASHAGKMGSYKRRQQDYAHQANLAAREIMAVDRQITAASIRAAVAGLERDRLETEIAQADLVEHHFRSKYTNAELYGWMHGQITGLYFQSYQLALELAKRAERCFRFERGHTSSNFIRSNGWDDLHGGLLAGDTLQLQLRQLDRAHQEQDRRELEVTKHVSLRQNAPLALLRLKQTGRCEVELPELLYDMDYPGHYMRRVRSVSVTIPAVTGPYTSLNAVLTMLTNEIRISGALRVGKFERDVENDDERFVTDFTAIQAIVTSTGQNDHGLFEPSFNDERYLPFEGAGAASRWRIELDPDCNRFDLGTIADVVLHVRYTARDGGQLLAQKAKEHWQTLVADAETLPLSRLFSLKHEFPTDWHRLRNVAEANGDHVRTIAITRDRFPTLFGRRDLHVGRIDLFGVPASDKQPTKLPGIQQPDNSVIQFSDGAPLGPLIHRTATVDVNVKDEEVGSMWRLFVALADVAASIDQLDDLLLVCHYDVRPAAG
jgi:peptidoglycan hydrolase-like protein with peptidoglycan-binding domain